jgi:glycosyltransferase involved in cell wall biosynthesis
MKIALDLRRIKNPGIGRYMKCLTEAMIEIAPEHQYLLILPPGEEDAITCRTHGVEKISPALKYYSLREQFALPGILRRHKVDLLHSPHFNLPLRRVCPAVVTIHDVIYLACKEDLPSPVGRLYYRAMMAASVKRADRIITDSEYSKRDIQRFFSVADSRMDVIYPGVDQIIRKSIDSVKLRQVLEQYGIVSPYLIYTGIYKLRKNHSGLLLSFRVFLDSFKKDQTSSHCSTYNNDSVDAYAGANGTVANDPADGRNSSVANLPAGIPAPENITAGTISKKLPEIQLVIAGPMQEGEQQLRDLARKLGIADRVVFTSFVPDADLAALYSGASVYACPSLYEGFGFTVLEAMACGIPVVCSKETSLPEVAGAAALYADARNPNEFGQALYQAFRDQGLRSMLVSKGVNNLQRFQWKHAAAQTLAVYEKAVGKIREKVLA